MQNSEGIDENIIQHSDEIKAFFTAGILGNINNIFSYKRI